ncbi:MAG: VanW family protein [Lachnospiraceae bacterium]|nr:VanW family protein [Lachnospiraceae bacterium]
MKLLYLNPVFSARRAIKLFLCLLSGIFILTGTARIYAAETQEPIREGIFAGPVELSGLNKAEAEKAIESYIDSLSAAELVLVAPGENTVTVTAGDLGLKWLNRELLEEAASLGNVGNIIRRYKALSDLKKNHQVYNIELSADENLIRSLINDRCTVYNISASDATITKSGGEISVQGGNDGESIDVEASVSGILSYISNELTKEGGRIKLVTNIVNPKGDPATLSKIKDRLGTFTTTYKASSADRAANVANGAAHINGKILYPGEQLSVYETVSPFTEENGYHLAGSYLNGLVVESLGGGICQVSTTLYQAVLRAELQVDQRSNHSMVVDYVPHSGDAAIAGTAKDFKFTNNLKYPVYIEAVTPGDRSLTFNIYGVEERPSNRTLEFESVDISEEQPEGEKIVLDPSQPAGFAKTQSAHVGYSSEYYKIVKVDGKEVSRERVNKSHYQAVPRTLTLGSATDNPVTTAALQKAAATGNIDYCKAVAASIEIDGGAGALAQAEALAAAGGEGAENAGQPENSGEQSDQGHNDEGHNDEGHHDEGHNDEEHHDEGHHDSEQEGDG